MFTKSIGRLATLAVGLLVAVLATGCAVAPRGPGQVGAMSGTNVPVAEARKAMAPVMGVVVEALPVTLADASEAARQRANGNAFGALLGYAAAAGLKSSKVGLLAGVLAGTTVGDAVARQAGPTLRPAEQLVVRLTTGKQVAVVQELDIASPLRIGEAVVVVYGPQTTRVVRQQGIHSPQPNP